MRGGGPQRKTKGTGLSRREKRVTSAGSPLAIRTRSHERVRNDRLTWFPGVTREQVEAVPEQASSFQELIQFRSKLGEKRQAGGVIGKKEDSLNPAQVVEDLHRV